MRCASPLPRRRAAWLALMSLGMFPLLCVTEAIPIPQAQHHPAVLPSTPHRRRELDDGGGEDGACRRARARVAQHSGSMPLQRALMDTLNASRAHQYATGLGALFLQASSTQLFPQRLQTMVMRLQAGEAVRVAVVRSRRRLTNQTDATARDYAVLLAEWLNTHYRDAAHEVRVISVPDATPAKVAAGALSWLGEPLDKQPKGTAGWDLVVLDTVDADETALLAAGVLRRNPGDADGGGALLDVRGNSTADAVQAYLEGLERTLLGLEKRGPPALVVLEGAEPSIARDLGFLVLQRSHANVLSVATGLTEAAWALSTVDHAGGKKTLRRAGRGQRSGLLPFPLRVKGGRRKRDGNNNATDGVDDDEDSNSIRASDVHRLLGEALVALMERENAIVACGLREQRPGRDGAAFVPRTPEYTCHQDKPPANDKTYKDPDGHGCDPDVPAAHPPASLKLPTRQQAGASLHDVSIEPSVWSALVAAKATGTTRAIEGDATTSSPTEDDSAEQLDPSAGCAAAQEAMHGPLTRTVEAAAARGRFGSHEIAAAAARRMVRRAVSSLGAGRLRQLLATLHDSNRTGTAGGTGRTVRVGVVGNSYPLGHHCDLYESPNNYIGNASTVPFRHLSQHGDSLFCSYPARFALWLQQTFPGATLDVVSFAIGGFSAREGAFYLAQDLENAFGGAPVHLFLVDFTSTQQRAVSSMHQVGRLGLRKFNRHFLQQLLAGHEGVFAAIRRRYPEAAVMYMHDGWSETNRMVLHGLLPLLERRYGVTPVNWWHAAMDMDKVELAVLRAPEPWNGGHPTWRAHQLMADLLAANILAAQADVACQPPLPIPAAVDADEQGDQPDRHALCNAAVTDAGPGREEAARYAVRACGAVFCEGTCSGEEPPLTLYTAQHKSDRKAGNLPSAFYFPPVTASASWVFAPETHFMKFGWIGGGGAGAALSDKAGKAAEEAAAGTGGGASEATEGEISFAVKYRRGEVRLEYLRTYEHIGKASVRVQDVSETSLCQQLERTTKEGVAPLPGATLPPFPAANATTTEAVELDGWWPTHASYGDVATIKLPQYRGSAERGGVGCALVRVTNLHNQRTKSSKFKLLAIMSF